MPPIFFDLAVLVTPDGVVTSRGKKLSYSSTAPGEREIQNFSRSLQS
jgi:hypothetical protein